MSSGGLVVGLGGAGLRVVARIRQVLAAGSLARPPETIRLLAFDVHKPVPVTGKLPQSYHFLIQLPQVEALPGEPVRYPRQAARAALLADLGQGAVSSLTLRGLATQFDALHRAGVTRLDAFVVCTTFGSTGSAWLVDMAYLLRHLAGSRLKIRLHAVLIAPEAYERAFYPSQAHLMTSFAVFKELESLQREREWGKGVSIYGGKYIGSLPGLLTRRPFDSVQVVDGQDLSSAPEAGVIPIVADGILCQLDPQASAVLEEAAQYANQAPDAAKPFSSFGLHALVYPSRLTLEQSVQRLIIGTIDRYLPLEKHPDTGRPQQLAEPAHLRPDSPYGRLDAWITDPHHSGVLQEVLREAGAAGDLAGRRALVEDMASRSLAQWKALFYQCEGAEQLLPQGDLLPEPIQPLATCHQRVFLQALAQRIAYPDPRLGAPPVYLQKLEQALSATLQDLDAVVETWRSRGEHSENEELLRSLAGARKDWESRRASLLGKLMPQAAQDAQERYIQARQAQAQYRQREAILETILQAVSAMRMFTHRLLDLSQRLLYALALLPDSVYNVALDQSQRLERELRFEAAVRSQQMIVDQGYEATRARLVYDEFNQRLSRLLVANVEGATETFDATANEPRLPFQLPDPNLEGEGILLDDADLAPEQIAALVTRLLSEEFAGALLRNQPDNSVLSFIHYRDPRADHLAERLVGNCAPAARLVTQVAARRNFLFAPHQNAPAGSTYAQALLAELQHHLGDVYVFETAETDRLTLFRYYSGLGLDNLLTFHHVEPRQVDPAALKPYVLWNL